MVLIRVAMCVKNFEFSQMLRFDTDLSEASSLQDLSTSFPEAVLAGPRTNKLPHALANSIEAGEVRFFPGSENPEDGPVKNAFEFLKTSVGEEYVGYARCSRCLQVFVFNEDVSDAHLRNHLETCGTVKLEDIKVLDEVLQPKDFVKRKLEKPMFPRDDIYEKVAAGDYFWELSPVKSNRKRSLVWNDFEVLMNINDPDEFTGYVRCIHCHKLLVHSSSRAGTSHLMRHLISCEEVAMSRLNSVLDLKRSEPLYVQRSDSGKIKFIALPY